MFSMHVETVTAHPEATSPAPVAEGLIPMAGGWSRDGAVQDQIDASVDEAVERARSRLRHAGPGRSHCEECDCPIPEARRAAVPGVTLCVKCQSELDAEQEAQSGFNRRGSKDSQLR